MLDADGDGTISQREEAAADAERYSFNGVGSNNGNITLNGVGDDEGQSIAITGNSSGTHLLSITAITDDTIIIINPWDSSKEITVSREEFETYVSHLSYVDLEKVTHSGRGGSHRFKTE